MKIDAFDVTVFHYLVKPIEEEKFGLIFERAVLEVQKKKISFCIDEIILVITTNNKKRIQLMHSKNANFLRIRGTSR